MLQVELFSPKLRSDAFLVTHASLYTSVPFLSGIEVEALSKLLQLLQPMVLVPRENGSTACMYLISHGLVFNRGRILGDKSLFGADCILANPRLRRFAGRALTYTEVHYLTNYDIWSVTEMFPIAASLVRWEAVQIRASFTRCSNPSAFRAQRTTRATLHCVWHRSRSPWSALFSTPPSSAT